MKQEPNQSADASAPLPLPSDTTEPMHSTVYHTNDEQWRTISKPGAAVTVQEQQVSEAFRQAIRESLANGRKARQAG